MMHVASAAAGADLLPMLTPTGEAQLPGPPIALDVSQGDTFVVLEGAPGGVLLRINTLTLATDRRADLDLSPQDIVLSADGTAVFVTGTDANGQTILAAFDRNLRMLSRMSAETTLAPVLTAVGAKGVALSGQSSKEAPGVLLFAAIGDDGVIAPADVPQPELARYGVSGGWYLAQDGLIFLNSGDSTSIFALDAKSAWTISDISAATKFDASSTPFVVAAQMPDQPCSRGAQPTFYLYDRPRDQLLLAEFAAGFGTLNILSAAQPGLPVRAEAAAGAVRATGLIDASCDGAFVWLGDQNSTTVIQFAVTPEANSLERVATIALPGRPVDFAAGDDGHVAMVLLKDAPRLVRFGTGAATTGGVIGSDAVRELQRALSSAGYLVGTIDGMFGPQTQRAATIFCQQNICPEINPVIGPADSDAVVKAIRDRK